jgi:hypothetical protein
MLRVPTNELNTPVPIPTPTEIENVATELPNNPIFAHIPMPAKPHTLSSIE